MIGECFAVGVAVAPTRFEFRGVGTHNGKITVSNPYGEVLEVTVTSKRILKDSRNLLLLDDGIADWITISNGSFTLRPGERRVVEFNVNVPSSYDYRDAVGALLVTATTPSRNIAHQGTSVTLRQANEVIVPVVVGLPGDIKERLAVESFTGPALLIGLMPGRFFYTIKNSGNVYENFTSKMRVTGFLDHTVSSGGGVYPGDSYSDELKWTPGILDAGIYRVALSVDYGRYSSQDPLLSERTVIVIPVWLIVIVALTVTAWFIRSRKPRIPRIRLKIER
ncbi:hypothetical protein [Methanothermobacter sp. CaT2]|uniref:hypothetical protein n=1 Tax=Methanothermobacter sp. CaT2 TaxID=866790 RepID=UPI00064E46D4|nr:hypothetical protein [Methanothermobacter sp. CaT2]